MVKSSRERRCRGKTARGGICSLRDWVGSMVKRMEEGERCFKRKFANPTDKNKARPLPGTEATRRLQTSLLHLQWHRGGPQPGPAASHQLQQHPATEASRAPGQ